MDSPEMAGPKLTQVKRIGLNIAVGPIGTLATKVPIAINVLTIVIPMWNDVDR
ncbi:hypothetical protein [Corynebacterium atrinae]|uniref:hypothetical protein n=1 Tax=Corynebacterium atrinae TaxID=1336740 RepID=UPI0025B40532|nr:hypothetical protein [Corynebacterium atrinae]